MCRDLKDGIEPRSRCTHFLNLGRKGGEKKEGKKKSNRQIGVQSVAPSRNFGGSMKQTGKKNTVAGPDQHSFPLKRTKEEVQRARGEERRKEGRRPSTLGGGIEKIYLPIVQRIKRERLAIGIRAHKNQRRRMKLSSPLRRTTEFELPIEIDQE